MNDLTIISCSYNTPQVTEVMLKSFVKVHGNGPFHFLISENFTDRKTRDYLNKNKVPYFPRTGATHVEGVELLLEACTTKYALLVDTDIVFKEDVGLLLDMMKLHDLTMFGEVCGLRGGYNLHERIHPWFCMVNVDNIKKHNIKFNDPERVKKFNSEGFYNNIPINKVQQGNIIPMYDVGATFYEDIRKVNFKVAHIVNLNTWYTHYEGFSWQRVLGHGGFEQLGNQVWQAF